MKKLLLIALLLLSGCTLNHGRNELQPGIAHPRKIADIDIRIHKGNFFTIGWKCAELSGSPAWVHPLLKTYLGCSKGPNDKALKPREKPWCDVYVQNSFGDFVTLKLLKHELRHCEGWRR